MGMFHSFRSTVRVAVAACILCLLLAACGTSTEKQWQEQYDLGQQYLLDLDYEQAIVAFTAAIEIDANNAQAYIGRAEAYTGIDVQSASDENLKLAIADYETALALDNGQTQIYLVEADIYLSIGDYENLITACSNAIDCGLGTANLYVTRGDAYLAYSDSAENRASALDDYLMGTELDPSLKAAYVKAARIYMETEDYENASELLAKALEYLPEDEELEALLDEVEGLLEELAQKAEEETLVEEYLQTALDYESAGELNAAIHTLLEIMDYWDEYEDLYEVWKRMLVPIQSVELRCEAFAEDFYYRHDYEYDDVKRMILCTESDSSNEMGYTSYEYNETDNTTTRRHWYADDYLEEVSSWAEDMSAYDSTEETYSGTTGAQAAYSMGAGVSSSDLVMSISAYPYRDVLNEEVLYNESIGDYSMYWSYAAITYDERGLVVRMEFYSSEGVSTGYALITYVE